MNERLTLAGVVLRMEVRPAGRLRNRLLLLITVTFSLSFCLLMAYGVEDAAVRGGERLGADLLVTDSGADAGPDGALTGVTPLRSRLPEGMEQALTALQGIAVVTPRYLSVTTADACCESGNLTVVGFDPSRDRQVLSWRSPGTPLPDGSDALLAGNRVLKATGGTLRLYNQPFRVTARLERSGDSRFDAALFVPLEGLRAMERKSRQGAFAPFTVTWERPTLLLVTLVAGVDPVVMARTLEQRFAGIKAIPASREIRAEQQRLERIARTAGPAALAVWLPAILAGAALQSLFWRDRRRGLGLLTAFGCSRGQLITIFGVEACTVSLAAMTIGMSGGYFILRLLAPVAAGIAGLPLLTGATAMLCPCMFWGGLAFAGIMAIDTAFKVRRLLRHDPADLMRFP